MNYSRFVLLLGMFALLWTGASTESLYADDAFASNGTRQMAIELSDFITIKGPNPIQKPDRRTTWDDGNIEAGDAIEDLGTYYLFYHAVGSGGTNPYQYKIGVSIASNPMGPFSKHGLEPIIDVGPRGTWEQNSVACPAVFKESDGRYIMWYGGHAGNYQWDIGLAYADNLLGPWTKYEGNPVLKNFGYIGGVVKIDGKYRLYSVYPISAPGYHGDYGPLAVALADKPEGPYVKYAGNPLMEKGQPGDWDDGGPSEAEVLYHGGMFHLFYGGGRGNSGQRLESLGYAYSFDGFKWFKYGKNPIFAYQSSPLTYALAEVHSIIEPPFVYIYHTIKPEHFRNKTYPWRFGGEHLGVTALVTQRPFSIDMPALTIDAIAAGATTALAESRPIDLGKIDRLSLTAECRYGQNAKKPIRVHVPSSYDGRRYDTTDLYTFDNDLQPGRIARKSFSLEKNVHYIMVIVENLDESASVTDVQITATLGG